MSVKLDTPKMSGELTMRELQSYLYRLVGQVEAAFNAASAMKSGVSGADVRYMIPEEAQAAIEVLRTDADKLIDRVQALSLQVAALNKWAGEYEKYIDAVFEHYEVRIEALEKTVNGG